MKKLIDTLFTSESGCVVSDKGYVSLLAKRAPIGEKFFPEHKLFSFRTSDSIVFDEYIHIEYSCFGVKRPDNIKPAFISALKDGEKVPLFIFDDVTIDGQKHTITAKAPKGSFDGINIEFYVDKILEAYINIYSFCTLSKNEISDVLVCGKDAKQHPFTPVDISAMFDSEYSLDNLDCMADALLVFDKENVCLFGIPFNVKVSGNNVIAPPAPPKENDEELVNFGAVTKRRYARPVSRDGETEIAIDKSASDIYFILTLSKKRHIRCLYGTNGEVLGGDYIDLYEPLKVTDTEFFMTEVIYEDGRRDTHLPLNIGTNRHGICGDTGVYAIPCFGKVKSIIIHNRLLDTDINIAAVTVNETDERLHPDMLIPEKDEVIVRKISSEKGFFADGTLLEIKNGALSMKLDLANGLNLIGMTSEFAPDMKVSSGAILKTRNADGEINEKFEFKDAQYFTDHAKFTYNYDGVIFNVTADISGKDSIKWLLEVVNMADEEFRKGIIFPCLPTVDFGSFSDNWYFLPKYQNINSNETIFMYEESAPSFPLQFMDIYSPKMQGGICVSTQERELVTRKYFLEKSAVGLDLYVEYPIIYGDIASGDSFTASPCLITAHSGDFREGFKIYKTWLDSWYTPYKCQNKQWYRECFWLLAEITDFFETEEMCSWPCWYNPETKEFNFRKILEEQKSITGVYPDILHMWSWCNTWRDGVYGQRWGNYGKEDYDTYGGIEPFKNALHDIRDNLGVQISLYMHPTLLTNSYEKFNLFKDTSIVKNEAGGTIGICGDSLRMCHAEEKFRDASLSMYPRIYDDLKIPLLYVDEFSLRYENRCYAENHGHHVPSSLLKTDRDYISRLKDIMPEEVVLYGEYAAVDVNARYIDCNISYYILDSIVDMIEVAKRAGDGDDRLSRVFIHAYRFAFPKIVQLILPMAMRNISWHPQKFMFFNAEAIYDSFWDCEESRGLDFTVKAYKLKKKYQDCFTSDYPEMLIETESPAICMNKFPSKDRIVYTIYNRAYSTFRGKALRVPYTQGATYYDAWNEKPLEYTVKDGFAEIYLEIGAQEMGCIVIE